MKYEEGMGDPLAMLAEECAEVIVEVMKCQRFGLAGTKAWVAAGNDPPRLRMVQELADVLEVASILQARGVFTVTELAAARDKKRLRLHELFGPEPTPEKGERIPSGEDCDVTQPRVAG